MDELLHNKRGRESNHRLSGFQFNAFFFAYDFLIFTQTIKSYVTLLIGISAGKLESIGDMWCFCAIAS